MWDERWEMWHVRCEVWDVSKNWIHIRIIWFGVVYGWWCDIVWGCVSVSALLKIDNIIDRNIEDTTDDCFGDAIGEIVSSCSYGHVSFNSPVACHANANAHLALMWQCNMHLHLPISKWNLWCSQAEDGFVLSLKRDRPDGTHIGSRSSFAIAFKLHLRHLSPPPKNRRPRQVTWCGEWCQGQCPRT